MSLGIQQSCSYAAEVSCKEAKLFLKQLSQVITGRTPKPLETNLMGGD